jgi:hypothetical protein
VIFYHKTEIKIYFSMNKGDVDHSIKTNFSHITPSKKVNYTPVLFDVFDTNRFYPRFEGRKTRILVFHFLGCEEIYFHFYFH